jgi:hypothetical protein
VIFAAREDCGSIGTLSQWPRSPALLAVAVPKAVMVSHDNIYFEANTVMTLIGDVVGNGKDIDGNDCMEERLISYLPLSHVAGMMVDIICPVALTANPCNGSYTWCVVRATPRSLH